MALSAPSAVTRLVLDTSAYARMRRGHPEVIARLASAEAVLVPTIVLGELEAGFRLGSRLAENRSVLAEFLDEPFVSILDVTPSVARLYGELFAGLRAAGTPIPLNDVWIAACSLDARAQLLTFDRDFEKVPGLEAAVVRDVE